MNNATNLKAFLATYNVEVPMLQRDYAQGRKSQEKVANEFLDAIFAVLCGNKKYLHIDFIYGYKEGEKFILIDGQQRIATLWLLHFYIYKKHKKLESISKELAKFSYAVRDSSKKFCRNLLRKDFDLGKNPSKAILDKGGEFEKEENLRSDPTIKAMLNMLDLIYERLDNKTDSEILIKNLDNITFYAFDMGEFSLGEELYIKMNARGKQLTDYENLKAYIESDSKIANEHTLLANIDNKWADMFFTPNDDIGAFDKRGIVFLRYANVFFRLLEGDVKSGEIKPMIDSANCVIDDFYKPLQDLENIILLDNLMDLYKNYGESFKKSGFLKFSDFDSFKNARDSLGYIEICYLYATLFFVLESQGKNIDTQALEDYLRVCKHFIENHRLDNPDKHISAFFNLFKTLSKGYKNIYEFLVQNPTHSFHSNIYALESRKAKLILQSRNGGDKWEEILNKTSNHCVLRGWVDYLLDFSDKQFKYKSWDSYVSYDEYDEHYDEEYFGSYNNPKENPIFDKFCGYVELTMQIFDEIQKDKEQNDFLPLFQRAFFSVGNYGFWAINCFYGNYCGEIFRDREAWNWLLSGKNNEENKPYFKKLLDCILESKKTNLFDILQDIIDNADTSNKLWWEQLLIRQVGLFEFLIENKQTFQKTRRIYFGENLEQIILLNKTRISYNQQGARDLLTYGFYCYCKQKGVNVSEYADYAVVYDYEQDDDIKPNFSINGKNVICESENDKMLISCGGKKYSFSTDTDDIFAEFDKIIKNESQC